MALEEKYLCYKQFCDNYRQYHTELLKQSLEYVLAQDNAFAFCRKQYELFVNQYSEIIDEVIKGKELEDIFPISFEIYSSNDNEEIVSHYKKGLTLVIGAMLNLCDKRDFYSILKLSAVFTLFELPGFIIPELYEKLADVYEVIKTIISTWNENRQDNLFSMRISEEGKGSREEDLLRQYQEGIKEEDISKVDNFMRVRDMGYPDFLRGPLKVVLELAYYADKQLAAQIVGKEGDPAFTGLICEYPIFRFDLYFLFIMAEGGNIWTRIEVAKTVRDLLIERLAISQPRVAISEPEWRAYRRLLTVYFGRALEILIELNKKGSLKYLLESLINTYRIQDKDILFYLGKCLGRAIAKYSNEKFIQLELASWNSGSDVLIMYVLYGVQRELDAKDQRLLRGWNNEIIRKWFKIVWGQYKGKTENYLLPFSSLDIAVHMALAWRWQYRENSVKIINGIVRRLKLVESMWFKNSIDERRFLKSIYAMILAHAFAWANLSVKGNLHLKSIDYIIEYINDERNWDMEPGKAWGMPEFFSKIKRAYLEN